MPSKSTLKRLNAQHDRPITYSHKVLVCGGRDFAELEWFTIVLDNVHATTPITTIISGCAHGADTFAINWGNCNNIPVEKFPADWALHGKTAGFLRNQQMLTVGKPELVVAFPGGGGTANMISIARNAGITIYIP